MFTPSMTNEEIEAVAYKDFLEIRGRVEIAKDKFVQRVRCTPPGFWALHSLQETHTLQTRSKNTWTVYFYYLYTTPAGAVKVSSMIYTSLPGDEGTDYLFMNNLDRFRLERVSSHFSQQIRGTLYRPEPDPTERPSARYLFHEDCRRPEDRSLHSRYMDRGREKGQISLRVGARDHGGEAGGACGDLPYFLRAGTAG